MTLSLRAGCSAIRTDALNTTTDLSNLAVVVPVPPALPRYMPPVVGEHRWRTHIAQLSRCYNSIFNAVLTAPPLLLKDLPLAAAMIYRSVMY